MNISNRLFAYPVLSNEKEDYTSALFNVEYTHWMQGTNNLALRFDISLDCSALERLILSGQAEYVIHLECSTTAYREVLTSFSKQINHIIPLGRLNGTFEAVACIIAKKDISAFTSTEWVDDFRGMSFSLAEGTILAYQNLQSLYLTKDKQEFTNAESIFSIYKRVTNSEKPIEVNLETSKIRIGLCTRDYDIYAAYTAKTEILPLFHSMLVLPVLIYVFEELKQEGAVETYRNREWFISLERQYRKRGVDLMEEVRNLDKPSYLLAQEAMDLPLSKALNQLPMLYQAMEED